MRGLSLVVASGGHSSSRCAGLSLSRPLLLRSTGSRRAGSAIVANGPSCSAACGILPDQGSNPCPLHWQVDSQPLHHQGSPQKFPLIHPFSPVHNQVALMLFIDFPFLFPSSCHPLPASMEQTVPDTMSYAGPSQISFINFILSLSQILILHIITFLNIIFIRKVTDNKNKEINQSSKTSPEFIEDHTKI